MKSIILSLHESLLYYGYGVCVTECAQVIPGAMLLQIGKQSGHGHRRDPQLQAMFKT